MITKLGFNIECALLRQFARKNLSKEMCDAVHAAFPTDLKMITQTGSNLVKEAVSVEDALSFVTERIRRPGPPQTLFVPPTRKKKVDENGNILKPLVGHKNKGEFFGKFNGKFLANYADDVARALYRNFTDGD